MSEFLETFSTIKSIHDEAYKTIQEAIGLEEIEKPTLVGSKCKFGS
jgi:hypothetical protein